MKTITPNIRYRILFILAILVLFFISGFFLMKSVERQRYDFLYEEQKIKYFDVQDNILAIKGSSYKNLVERIYSLWDGTLRFLESPDSLFAKENFDILVTKYDYDVFWIYDKNFNLVYSRNATLDDSLHQAPIPDSHRMKMFSNAFYSQFFHMSDDGLLEIRGATINHPSDTIRPLQARGYLFIGKLWDEYFIRELEDASKSHIRIFEDYDHEVDEDSYELHEIAVVKPLFGYAAQEIGQIEFLVEEKVISKFNQFANNLFMLYLVLTILLTVIISFLLVNWIYKPLRLISVSLVTNNVVPIEGLSRKNNEFGRLAVLIKNFFRQKVNLEKEIIQREKTEETLKKSEERFRALVRHLPDYVVLHQEDKIIFINEAGCRKFKYPMDELIGSSILEHVHEDDHEKVIQSVSRRMMGESVDDYEIRLIDKEGITHDVIVRSSLIPYGDTPATLTVLVDITERKKFEIEILESRARLNAILDNLPYKAWLKDLHGRYIAVNKPFARFYGLSPSELLGKTDYDICPLEVASRFQADDQRVIDTKMQLYSEAHDPNLTEGEWYETFKSPIFNKDGNVIGITGISRDITELKTKQLELIRAKEDADSANHAKQQFLSTMSHEMRTPLNAIIGISNLLMEEDPREDQMENLKTLNFSAEHLLSLISDILDFSKIEAGKIDLEETDFNLHDLLNSVKQTFVIRAKAKGVEVDLNMSDDLPVALKGDSVRLNQIITNLVGNAVKFTEKGKISLDASLMNMKGNKAYIRFIVSDSGVGIPADKLDDIFNPFIQASSTAKYNIGGTGLGLAITKRLVELQKGSISVESELGKGSEFTFIIPYTLGKEDQTKDIRKTRSDELQSIKNVNILLVEDNIINQVIASKYLMKWGAIVDEAENGLVALEKIKQNHYDIILMDLQMPELDGYDTARAIRKMEDPRIKDIPIIALTASALLEVREQVMQAGMNDYVTKPFNPVELNHKIVKYVTKI
ncbi:MAG: PAS domain S-box protein [Bacteroidetes bacterium]|nr:PAS domain S-box protein [Bacteroidota bacterium]